VDSSKEQGAAGRIVEDLALRKVGAVGWILVRSIVGLAQKVGLSRLAVGNREGLRHLRDCGHQTLAVGRYRRSPV